MKKGKGFFTTKDGRIINNETIAGFVKEFPMPEPFAWKIMPHISGFFVAIPQTGSESMRVFLYENGSWYQQPRFYTKEEMCSLAEETKTYVYHWVINPNLK